MQWLAGELRQMQVGRPNGNVSSTHERFSPVSQKDGAQLVCLSGCVGGYSPTREACTLSSVVEVDQPFGCHRAEASANPAVCRVESGSTFSSFLGEQLTASRRAERAVEGGCVSGMSLRCQPHHASA